MYKIRKFRDARSSSKLHNIRQTYNGIAYHSKLEAKYAMDLDLRLKGNDIKSWERQVKISIDVNGEHICNYYIDFIITHNDGILEYVEVKGMETQEWRLKWKLCLAIMKDQIEKDEILMSIVKA